MAASAKQALNFQFKTVALNERYKSENEETLAGALVYVLLILLYTATILYGVQVAQGVIEEKSNRVMEIMIGAVRPGQLLAGKIIGIGALALTQMFAFALTAAAILVLSGHGAQGAKLAIATVPASTIAYLLIYFFLGFFSYSTLFAGIGAL